MSIGVFARSVGVPASALRYYDEVGLLSPAHVDPVSGYRYYDAAQNERARLLGELRALGLSLVEMAAVVEVPAGEAALRLAMIAAGRFARAEEDRVRLEALIARLRRDEAGLVVRVDAGCLAIALERVASQAGPEPFHVVQWVVGAAGVALLASDRFRLARWLVQGEAAPGRERRFIMDVSTVAVVAGWLRAVRWVECIAGQGIVLCADGAELGLPVVDGNHPDLTEVFERLRPEPVHRGTIPATVDSDAEVVDVRVDGVAVRFTTELLKGALSSMVGAPVELWVRVQSAPVLLRSPAQPCHEVIVMPFWSRAG